MVEARRLPRGRHELSREQVEDDQRLRILVGFAESMADQGYVNTPVAEILRRAGVSRETFYRLYTDKLDGFLAAFDVVGEFLIAELDAAVAEPGEPLERVDRTVTAYLRTIAAHRAYARLFLVEASAVGALAIDRRNEVQQVIVDRLAEVLGAQTDAARFACQVVVASVSALVVAPVVADDHDAVVALGPPVVDHLRRLHAAGLLT